MANIDKIIKSKYQPKQTNVAWVDLSGETPVEKHFINGRWVAISGGGGSSFRTVIVDTEEYVTIGDFIKGAVGENGVIYLYPNSNPYGENTYTELLWVEDDSKFEIIDNDIPIDDKPTEDSANPVSSGGVYTALGYKADNIIIVDLSEQQSHRYQIKPNSFTICGLFEHGMAYVFTMKAALDNEILNVWYWSFDTGATAPTISWPSITWCDSVDTETVDDVVVPIIESNKHYEISVMDGYGTITSSNISQNVIRP